MHINHLKIVGCGGHCKVVLDALSLTAQSLEISLCDNNKEMLGREIAGLIVDSTMDSLANFTGLIHLAIGNNQARQHIIENLIPQSSLLTIIHPKSVISNSAIVGQGSFIAAQAILGPESKIGISCIINHSAVVDHEVEIGDCTHIAPNCTLGGQVKIGHRVMIGAGSVILPGIRIGDNAIVGAGAVVVKDVVEGKIVKGIPAV